MSFLAFFLLIPALIRGILEAPPRDLASLIDAKATLQTLAVDTDEDSLIKLLTTSPKSTAPTKADLQAAIRDLSANEFQTRRKGRKLLESAGPASIPFLEKALQDDDPEVRVTAKQLLDKIRSEATAATKKDTGYVKRLLAIRVLEKMKAAKAVPALQKVSAGNDVTLAAAATEAIAIIQGKKLERKNAAKQLTALLTKLPDDVGFAAATDLETGSRDMTATQWLELIKKAPGTIPNKLLLRIQQTVGMSTTGILALLSETGNMRIDSIVLITSNRIGAERRSGYAGFVFNGLYDPARLAGAMKRHASGLQELKHNNHTILYEKYGPALSMLNKNTLLLTIGPQRDGTHMLPLLDAVTKKLSPDQLAAKKKTLQVPCIALNNVIKGSRLAAAGQLSAAQKAMIDTEVGKDLARVKQRMKANPDPRRQVEASFLEFALALTKVAQFTGSTNKKHEVTIRASCSDKQAAAALCRETEGF